MALCMNMNKVTAFHLIWLILHDFLTIDYCDTDNNERLFKMSDPNNRILGLRMSKKQLKFDPWITFT